jgi:hypothetical protein
MSGVFRNIDHPPPHPLASVYPPAFGAGGGHTRWVERGWRKTPDTALYSIYVSTLWAIPMQAGKMVSHHSPRQLGQLAAAKPHHQTRGREKVGMEFWTGKPESRDSTKQNNEE